MPKEKRDAVKQQILIAALEEQLQQTNEAKISNLQRVLAYKDQEAEFEVRRVQREAALLETSRDTRLSAERHRPCHIVYTEIYFDQDEEAWACKHGGVIAYGDTPSMACENFDYLWEYGK